MFEGVFLRPSDNPERNRRRARNYSGYSHYDQESGLYYNYFRDYDPTTGRYIESDPIGLAGGLNAYAYAGENPIRRVDPLGLIGPQESSIQNEIESAIVRGDIRQLRNLLDSGGLSPEQEALARAGLKQAQILSRSSSSVSRIAEKLGRTNREIRRAIEMCKQEGLPRSGPIRNPDVVVDLSNGEVYPRLPSGGIGDSIGNIHDYLSQ